MDKRSANRPIFHLSFPVRDIEEAIDYYTGPLGGVVGRRAQAWADVALFGAQLTLQHQPQDVSNPMPRSRHFGGTLTWEEWVSLTESLGEFVEEPSISHTGTEREQAKAMIADPSGNLIEIKAYRDPRAVLGPLVSDDAP